MTTNPNNQTTSVDHDWPEGVTVRILTRVGLHLGNLDATVDIHDDQPSRDARSTARCRPCGQDYDHGLTFRQQVLNWAQTHADQCTALPRPVPQTTA